MYDVPDGIDWVVKDVRKRLLERDRNLLLAVTGQTGSGKSNVALSLAKMIDPKFDETQIAFSPEEFLEILQDKKLKKGSVVIWDEASVGLSDRDFMSISNKVVSAVLTTFRSMNICVMFTLPFMEKLDKSSRMLLHGEIKTRSIHYKNRECTCKWYYLDYNPTYDRWYKNFPIVPHPDGGSITLEEIDVPHAEMTLWKSYLKKSEIFKESVRKSALETINEIKTRKEQKSGNRMTKEKMNEIAESILANRERYQTATGILSAERIQADFDVGNRVASKIRAICELRIADSGGEF